MKCAYCWRGDEGDHLACIQMMKVLSKESPLIHRTRAAALRAVLELASEPRFHYYYRKGGIHDWNCKTCALRTEMQEMLADVEQPA